ncbi:hypothetical protein GU243_06125 [Pseudarthrobacter psychrotolerans]|uniref:Helix-turn-helix domain-containing protein n=1 Tax=Pseudarthrobacter psychrotolerans TaxID=2697569 RepID=A0A6P1NIJ5_9MICC|nr:hypothetical protein [Pseudarthrobacter psychrotolerans]QHK19389.1 hypothetical protein GU243_06125 [Pseudarthrobacter psychrotolerans]
MTVYNPRRPLLGAFINGPSAQILTAMLKREEVVRRSKDLPTDLRNKLLDDWDAMAEAARLYRERCGELRNGSPAESAAVMVSGTEAAGTQPVLWPVRMVAMVIGRTDSRVRQMLRWGELEGVKVDGRWRVSEDTVGDYGMRQLLARQSA